MAGLLNPYQATPPKQSRRINAKWNGNTLTDAQGNSVMQAPSLLDAASQINQFMPVTGDIQAGLLAANDVKQGNYGNAALNAVGLLPFMPALGGTIGKNAEYLYHGTSPKAAKAIKKSGFDISKSADGSIWFTSNPKIGEVAASQNGAVIKSTIPENLKLGGWEDTDKYSTDELINMGYDGLKLIDDGEITYQIFNPAKLKIVK